MFGGNNNYVAPVITVATLSATSSATSITSTSASIGGEVTSDGGAVVTSRGLVWGTSTGSSTYSSTVGSGIGTFTSSLTGLSPATRYYVRSFAINSKGTSYGAEKNFITLIQTPIASSTTTSTITSSTAILGGVLSSTGGATTSVGIMYSTDVNFGTSSTTTISSNGNIGTYTTTVTNLAASTNYYVKSFATNSAGTSYGPQVSFTTPARPIAVGDSYGGGIVIYIADPSDPGYDANTTHGLIAAKVDLGSMNWNNGSIAGTSNNYFGAGIGNTSIIIAQSGSNGGTNYAAKACDDYTVTETVGGVSTTYSDWYLGSTFEIQKMMFPNPASSYLTGLANGYYWASNEQTASGPSPGAGAVLGSALYVTKANGGLDQWNKTGGSGIMGVRAIRKF